MRNVVLLATLCGCALQAAADDIHVVAHPVVCASTTKTACVLAPVVPVGAGQKGGVGFRTGCFVPLSPNAASVGIAAVSGTAMPALRYDARRGGYVLDAGEGRWDARLVAPDGRGVRRWQTSGRASLIETDGLPGAALLVVTDGTRTQTYKLLKAR